MRFIAKPYGSALCLAVLVAALLLLTWHYFPSVTHTITLHDGEEQSVILPDTSVLSPRPPDETVHYRLTLQWEPHQLSSFMLLTNACVQAMAVNSREVSLQGCESWTQEMNLRPYLQAGENTIELTVYKMYKASSPEWYGTYLLDFYVLPWAELQGKALMMAWIATLMILLGSTLRVLGFDRVTVLAAGFFVIGASIEMVACSYHQLAYDLIAHFDYARYMHSHWWREDPLAHNIFRHPPLYYLVASAMIKAFGPPLALGGVPLRVLALLSYLVFLVFGLLTIRRLAASPLVYRLASLALILWPEGLFFSSRVSNDNPLYAFYAITVYFLVLWHQTGAAKYFWRSVMAASLALMVKFNALILFGCIGVLFLPRARQWRNVFREQAWHAGLGMALMCFSLATGPLYSAYKARASHNDAGIYGDMIFTGGFMSVDRSPEHVLTFSLKRYLAYPFVYQGTHETRQNFWEYLLRTSAYDAWPWAYGGLAISMLLMLWGNVLLAMVAALKMDAAQRRDLACEAVLIVMPILALIYFRYSYMQSGAQDFRYIYPVIIPVGVWWAKSYDFYRTHGNTILQHLQLACGAGAIGLGQIYLLLHFTGVFSFRIL